MGWRAVIPPPAYNLVTSKLPVIIGFAPIGSRELSSLIIIEHPLPSVLSVSHLLLCIFTATSRRRLRSSVRDSFDTRGENLSCGPGNFWLRAWTHKADIIIVFIIIRTHDDRVTALLTGIFGRVFTPKIAEPGWIYCANHSLGFPARPTRRAIKIKLLRWRTTQVETFLLENCFSFCLLLNFMREILKELERFAMLRHSVYYCGCYNCYNNEFEWSQCIRDNCPSLSTRPWDFGWNYISRKQRHTNIISSGPV